MSSALEVITEIYTRNFKLIGRISFLKGTDPVLDSTSTKIITVHYSKHTRQLQMDTTDQLNKRKDLKTVYLTRFIGRHSISSP